MANIRERFKKMWIGAKRVGRNIIGPTGRQLDEAIRRTNALNADKNMPEAIREAEKKRIIRNVRNY